jgi:riboflavin kinase/FMN adenylyltransferase
MRLAGAKVVNVYVFSKFSGKKNAKSQLFRTFAAEMDIIRYPVFPVPLGRYAATIGFFDGVHRGHCFLLEQLRHEACARGMKSMAITFDRHPREVAHPGWHPQLLTTLDEKCALLAQTGIDVLVVLSFDEAMASLTARQFMADVLRDRLHADLLLTGYDNRFGHDRRESFADYVGYGQELDMEVVCAQPLRMEGATVNRLTRQEEAFSSSLVRQLLLEGDVSTAEECLGRYYSISGHVVHGECKGHGLGFPTANLVSNEPLKLIPARGAYAVEALLPDGTCRHAMTNIGTRPTFHGEQQTLETHIFDFTQDIYDQPLTVIFVARLRDEMFFPSPEALASQLAEDRLKAEEMLASKG